jgi:deoxyribodipyrimidine photolyase
MCHLQEVKRYEAERTANKSTYWVIFELIWRDYYRYFTLRWGNAIFMEYGITNRKVGPDCLPRCSF